MEKLIVETPTELIKEIRELGQLTNEWDIIMDFAVISPYCELGIPEAFIELEKLSLYRFNKVFKPYDKNIDKNIKYRIIKVMKDYYNTVFQQEILFLQPFLTRILKKEMDACRKEGMLRRINGYHARLELNGSEIIFHKNKEYHYAVNHLNKIIITASTFLSPHLMMYEENNSLYITMVVAVEDKKDIVPADLVQLLKALGDETRLKLLREIGRLPASTQSLAVKLKLTEAGISKHLKLLHQAGLVNKQRQGNYILYGLNQDTIDFIPYTLYEYIMRYSL
jgi:DNA-binding transcriptional ArsR family regulator